MSGGEYVQFLVKSETDLQTAFDDAADDFTNTGGACYSHTTFELRELPAAVERFVKTGTLSLDIALPHDSNYFGVTFDDVRVFLVGLPPGISSSVNINLVKAGSSTFKDEAGRLRRFTHDETKPAIQFSYDGTSCAVLSTSDSRLVGGNMRDIYIRHAPYGLWNLEVRGHEALDLAAVTAVRFEFNLHRQPGSFGGADVFFTGGGGCAAQLADRACTADGSAPRPLTPAPAPSRPCTNFVEFQPYTDEVTAACCTDASTCDGGFPSACDAACEAVLLPMQRACGKVLEMIRMVDIVAAAVAECPGVLG
jgi:hypothetical protein